MLRRLLIANRGEIALRVVRACRELGIGSVAVYSEADAAAPHVLAADRAEPIGPAAPSESYLSIPNLIGAARRAGADAIHPGYGFLAESDAFAAACADAGLTFVGPSAGAIARMGSKVAARQIMEAAGVAVVPGLTPREQSDEGVGDAVREVGFPALIKPSEGGGGKGMRLVRDESNLVEAVQAARREALSSFGDGTLYVERFIDAPRHVEFQVFGDTHGTVVHLFERECSVQRRHQKIIEESPSPVLTPTLRERMGSTAVAAARAVGYHNAGTVEFLLDGEGDDARFYFLEMNTRLQVEHPVTEAVTGTDLVCAQLLVASGEKLPWAPSSLSQRGHAVECRVYAEDPDRDFIPQAGRLLRYAEPTGPGIRIDAGVVEGGEVPVYYDPLLAKLIAYGETRDAAIRRASAALRSYVVLGVRTNIAHLLRILDHPRFRSGGVDTGFVEREHRALTRSADGFSRTAAAAAAAFDYAAGRRRHTGAAPRGRSAGDGHAAPDAASDASHDPWAALRGWRG